MNYKTRVALETSKQQRDNLRHSGRFSSRFSHGLIDYTRLRSTVNTEFSSELPHHIHQLFAIIQTLHLPVRARILDMTAHVGGFTLPYATMWPAHHVTSYELFPLPYAALQYNIGQLQLHNVTAVHRDSCAILKQSTIYDMVYVDPPWGGTNYKSQDKMHLYLGDQDVVDVVRKILEKKISPLVLLKAPNNFDMPSMPHTLHHIMSGTRVSYQLLVFTCKK